MSNLKTKKKIDSIPFLDSAEKTAKQYGQDFWENFQLQAKLLAHREKAEVVLERHVDEAAKYLLSPKINSRQGKLRKLFQESLKIIGGGLVGGFISGFVNSVPSAQTQISLVELHISIVAMGILGIIFIFIGILMEIWE